MNELFKLIGTIVVIIVMVAAGFLVSLLITHIMLDIAILYDVQFISQMTFKQLFGAIFLFGILTTKLSTKLDSNSSSTQENISKVFSGLLGIAISSLLSWWFAYLFYNFV